TSSWDGDVSGCHVGPGTSGGQSADYWIIKLDTAGNLMWQKCLGGSSDDFAYTGLQTADSGYIIVGGSYCTDGDVTGNHGDFDIWIVKLRGDKYSAIASLPNDNLSIYPNPVQSQLNLSFIPTSNDLTETIIQVFDLSGREKEVAITFMNTLLQGVQARVNTSSLPDGFYTLRI